MFVAIAATNPAGRLATLLLCSGWLGFCPIFHIKAALPYTTYYYYHYYTVVAGDPERVMSGKR